MNDKLQGPVPIGPRLKGRGQKEAKELESKGAI